MAKVLKSKSHRYLKAKSAFTVEDFGFDLPETLATKAEKELGETPARRKECLDKLKKLLQGEKDLNPRLDDDFLVPFLRVRKYDVERTFKHVKSYYKTRADYHEFFQMVGTPSCTKIVEDGIVAVLPYRNTDGCLVLLFNSTKWDYNVYSLDELFGAFILIMEWASLSTSTQVNGVHFVCDVHGFGLYQVAQIRPRHLLLGTKLLENSIPIRTKTIQYVNMHRGVQYLLTIFKSLLSKKMQDRIFLNGTNDYVNLLSTVDAGILPAEYGGNSKSVDMTDFVQGLAKIEEDFRENSKFGYKAAPVGDNEINSSNADSKMLEALAKELDKVQVQDCAT